MGIPDMPFADPNYFKDEFVPVAGRQVLLTFRTALAEQRHRIRITRVAGRHQGIFPRSSTSCWARRIQICCAMRGEALSFEPGNGWPMTWACRKKNVVFFNRFVELEELMRFHRRGGHLSHGLILTEIADHLGARWLMRSANGNAVGVHALLARDGIAGG